MVPLAIITNYVWNTHKKYITPWNPILHNIMFVIYSLYIRFSDVFRRFHPFNIRGQTLASAHLIFIFWAVPKFCERMTFLNTSWIHYLYSLYRRNTSWMILPWFYMIFFFFTNQTLLGGVFAAIRCHSLYILNTLFIFFIHPEYILNTFFIYPYVTRFISFHNYGKNAFLSISTTDDNELIFYFLSHGNLHSFLILNPDVGLFWPVGPRLKTGFSSVCLNSLKIHFVRV